MLVKKAYVEITNRCNLRCPFCPGSSRPAGDMGEEQFRLILERLRGRVLCLYFHVMGEPLLHPQIGRFLCLAGEAGLPVNLTTNGVLLGRRGDELLGRAALRQVNVSLHSRAGAVGEREYLGDVLGFADKARACGVLVAFRLWNGEEGDNAAMLEGLAQHYGLSPRALGGAGDGRGVRLGEGVYLNRAMPFRWPDPNGEDFGESGFCMGLRDQIGILCDGTAVPCCLDGGGAVPLGNLLRQSLEEILESPRARAIREGFGRRRAVEELCRKCGYRGRFN